MMFEVNGIHVRRLATPLIAADWSVVMHGTSIQQIAEILQQKSLISKTTVDSNTSSLNVARVLQSAVITGCML